MISGVPIDSRVLLVTERSDPSRYFQGAAARLRQRGFDIALVTVAPPGRLHKACKDDGVAAFSLGSSGSKSYPRAIGRLIPLIRSLAPGIVHASEPISASLAAAAVRLSGRTVATVYHRHHCRAAGRIQAYQSRVAGRWADLTMAVSGAVARAAREFDRVPERRIRVAHNGIGTLRSVAADEVAGLRRTLGIPDAARFVVMVARLHPDKGHLDLLRAVPAIAARVTAPLHVVLVGRGPVEGEIRDYLQANRMDNVHLAGHVDDVAPWLELADVVAVPSHREPFGLVALEAWAARRPLVASGVDGLLEFIENGRSGLLVSPGDDQALAGAVARLLEDRSLAARLVEGGACRLTAGFTEEHMVDAWIDCYRYARTLRQDGQAA